MVVKYCEFVLNNRKRFRTKFLLQSINWMPLKMSSQLGKNWRSTWLDVVFPHQRLWRTKRKPSNKRKTCRKFWWFNPSDIMHWNQFVCVTSTPEVVFINTTYGIQLLNLSSIFSSLTLMIEEIFSRMDHQLTYKKDIEIVNEIYPNGSPLKVLPASSSWKPSFFYYFTLYYLVTNPANVANTIDYLWRVCSRNHIVGKFQLFQWIAQEEQEKNQRMDVRPTLYSLWNGRYTESLWRCWLTKRLNLPLQCQ